MKEQSNHIIFSEQDLLRFHEAQNKILNKVICVLWQNNSNKADVVELIDRVEIIFEDGYLLKIACNSEGNGLETTTELTEKIAKDVVDEFKGKIKIFAVDASGTAMWKDLIGKKLNMIQLTKENDQYKADSLLMNFGPETRIISVHPIDGLIIDFYEHD